MSEITYDGSPRPMTEGCEPPPRKKSGVWAGLGFVLLMCGALVITQIANYSGPSIRWIENDVDEALRQARESGRRVFLYLYEANCPITLAHDQTLFGQRMARQRLSEMVACRVEVGPTDRLRARFGFDGTPLMMVLDADGKQIITPIRGAVGPRQFRAYVRSK